MLPTAGLGGAVLFSTHVLEVAQALCDEVVIIKRGRLVVAGPMASVIGDSSLEDAFLHLSTDAPGAAVRTWGVRAFARLS